MRGFARPHCDGARIQKRRRASTLIELLVVIAMIGVLMSLLLPSLQQSMRIARATVCKYNLKELGHILIMYRMDNHGWLPARKQTESAIAGMEQPVNDTWFSKLYPVYLNDPKVLACPGDPYAERLDFARRHFLDPRVAEFSSYGMNNFMQSADGGAFANVEANAPSQPLETILLADLGPDFVRSAMQRALYSGPARNGGAMAWGDSFDPFTGGEAAPWVTARHGVGINMMTLQGHVKAIRTVEVMRSPIQRYYDNCAAGGCTLCNELSLFHYSFAKDRLYWWTGSVGRTN